MQFSMMRLANLMHITPASPFRADDHLTQHLFDGFRLNQAVINNIQQCVHLLADIQRHRACSLAILSGNLSFENQVCALHRKINARLAYLDRQTELADVIDKHEWDTVLSEWQVVGFGWRNDNVLHNFELHSHLLDFILNIVRNAGRWVLRSGSYSEHVANHHIGHDVFAFVFATHLYQIETLGRLRGLGTHVASSGCTDNNMRMRIEFLLQRARHEQIISREFLDAHALSVSKNIPAVLDMQRSETSLQECLALLTDITQSRCTPSDALTQQIFDLASTVINAKLAFTEQILAYLHLAIEEMLESLLDETVQEKGVRDT
ncbi:MAG TPA: hypothetical protein PLF22_01955 [Pseudomonadales bacterium]|nr:hypothetical protein [Pseudomonadales bacterium]